MTHQQSQIVASLLSGRVDVKDLTYEQRSLVGIRFDPKDSDEFRDDALRAIERLFVQHIEKRAESVETF